MATSDLNPGTVFRGQDFRLDQITTNTLQNQLKGVYRSNSVGSGIPQAVANLGVSVGNAATGTTCTVSVTFQSNPADPNFNQCRIYVKGYQSNPAPVQVVASSTSPATFVLNNTGENVVVLAQSAGNGGATPLSKCPTIGVKLPKSTAGGVGTNTITYINTPTVLPSFSQSGVFGVYMSTSLGADPSASATSGNFNNALTSQVYAIPFFPLIGMTLKKAIFTVAGSSGGGTCYLGIYDSSKTLLVSGSIATTNQVSATNYQITLSAAQTVNAGTVYYVAFGTDSATPVQTLGGFNNGNTFRDFNANTVVMGKAANSISGGLMPSTLGALTSAAATGPAVLLQS